MLFSRNRKTNKKRHYAWLYSIVFTGRLSLYLVFLLLFSFLLQPVNQAYSAGSAEVSPEVPVPIAEDVQVQEPALPVEESPPEDTAVIETTDEQNPETGDLDVVDETDFSNEQEVIEAVDGSENTSATTTDDVVTDMDSDDELQTENGSEGVADMLGEQSEPEASSTVSVQFAVTEQNYYQFDKQSCVSVGDGAFQCTNKKTADIDTQSVVYSAQGESGNLEIFLKTARGKVKQITENNYDDSSPHYDAESMRIVWQRLVDGRYQIILFDIMDDEETQLTFSRTNNMEPKVSDAGIVWQAWDNNDWEIMYFDGTYTDQLTDNDGQDVAPVVQDDYVMWSVLGAEDQQARVYSIATKEIVSIVGHEGGSIVNPRFVLVYDTEFENGDIITQGFDPSTGLSEPIAAKPAPAPINVPETDPTGEIRALLQGKTQKDEKDIDTNQPDNDAAANPPVEPGTLNLKASDNSTTTTNLGGISISSTTAPVEDFELTDYDLVLLPHQFTSDE